MLFPNESCSDTFEINVNGKDNEQEEYYQKVIIGSGRGYGLNLKNIYGQSLIEIEIIDNTTTEQEEAYISVNDEVVYTTTDTNATSSNLINVEVEIEILIYDNIVKYFIGDVYQGQSSTFYSLPIKTMDWTIYNKTNTTRTLDYTYIGGWIVYDQKTKPIENEGVTSISFDGTYRYYTFNCTYSEEEPTKTLRVYYDDDTIQYNLYEDYIITYNENLLEENEYLTTEEEQEKQQEAQIIANSQYCQALNICSEQGRFAFAILVTLGLTFFSILIIRKQLEDTAAASLIPVFVYVLCFIYFAYVGMFKTWFIVLNAVMVAGTLASILNPINYFSGGRGGVNYQSYK